MIALSIPSSGGGEWRYGVCTGLAGTGAVLAFKGREAAWQVDKPRPIAALIGIWINLPLAVLAGVFWWLAVNLRM